MDTEDELGDVLEMNLRVVSGQLRDGDRELSKPSHLLNITLLALPKKLIHISRLSIFGHE